MQNTLLLWFITCQSLPLPTRAAQSWEKGFNYVVVSFPQLFRAYVGICRCQMKDIQPDFAGNKDPKKTLILIDNILVWYFSFPPLFVCYHTHYKFVWFHCVKKKRRKTCMKRHVFILLVFRPFRKKHVTSLQAKRVSRRWLVWIEAVGAVFLKKGGKMKPSLLRLNSTLSCVTRQRSRLAPLPARWNTLFSSPSSIRY